MIPMMNIVAWSNVVPWVDLRQVEQDLIISRAIEERPPEEGTELLTGHNDIPYGQKTQTAENVVASVRHLRVPRMVKKFKRGKINSRSWDAGWFCEPVAVGHTIQRL